MSVTSYIKRGLKYILTGIPEKKVSIEVLTSRNSEKLLGKRIIITGGGSGLGYDMAKRFVAEGAKVLISGRNEEKLKIAASELGCEYIVYDVKDVKNADSFIYSAKEKLGGLNCLVNNAGISLHEGTIRDVSIEQFENQINTNLKGAYFLSKSFIKVLEDSKNTNGQILFISSERGQLVDDLPYGLTKSAINSLVQGLSYRLLESGIRVNAISPGVTASNMTGFKKDGNLSCSFYKLGHIYMPEEIAEVATFLLSDFSKCISGQIILCNNGQTVNSYLRK